MGAPDPIEYYSALLKKHGPNPASVDATQDGLNLRHDILHAALGVTYGKSVLDVGCGYGAFRAFVRDADYTGVDICPAMIEAARAVDLVNPFLDQYCSPKFFVRDIVLDPFPQQFDYVVASGLFQFNHGMGYAERLISAMWSHTRHVLAFNMLSWKGRPLTNGEFFVDPWRIGSFCHTLTTYVALDHSYRSNDFTMILTRGLKDTETPAIILPATKVQEEEAAAA